MKQIVMVIKNAAKKERVEQFVGQKEVRTVREMITTVTGTINLSAKEMIYGTLIFIRSEIRLPYQRYIIPKYS